MIVAVTGEIKNAGDFLIADRGVRLVERFVDPDVVRINRHFYNEERDWPTLERADRVFLTGGPALQKHMFPGIYPSRLLELVPRLVPFGLGWKGARSGFRFNTETQEALRAIHDSIPSSSVRDDLSRETLESHGFENVTMTGCPAWYDLERLDAPLQVPSSFRRIALSAPEGRDHAFPQALDAVKERFPRAERICAFHRGIFPDRLTPFRRSRTHMKMAAQARLKGFKVMDMAYGLERMQRVYEDFDLHIGYRVHAHLYFLSRRIPSILLSEDVRGSGQAKSLGMEEIRVGDATAMERLHRELDAVEAGCAPQKAAVERMRENFGVMQKFLENA